MTKTSLGLLSLFLFIALVLPCFVTVNATVPHSSNTSTFPQREDGWIEQRDNITILHLYGSSYDMGYQQGVQLKKEIQENVRACLSFCDERGFPYQRLMELWDLMKPQLPQQYLDEMQGIADGSHVSFENISIFNFGLYSALNCASFAAWGPATSDGQLYHARSSDFPLTAQDPVTGIYLQENQLIIIRKPQNGYASFAPSFAGEVDCESGLNEKGIMVGMLSSWSHNATYHGIEVGFRMRMVLDYAASADEAIAIITSNRTLGYNYVLSDGQIPEGFVLETNADSFYVGTWNTSSEATRPFWVMDHVVRRTNIYVDPRMAASQRAWYNPTLFPLLSILCSINPMGNTSIAAAGPWLHYEALNKGIQQHWGALNLINTMEILRDVYRGKTDLRFCLIQQVKPHTTIYQIAACPQTGDILISFASRDQSAYENPVHVFNLFDLLNESI
jgi:hypothetical protein